MKPRVEMSLLAAVLAVSIAQSAGAAPTPGRIRPDAGLIASIDTREQTLVQGSVSGDFEELYPGIYPGYGWARQARALGTNGLFQVDFTVYRRGVPTPESHLSILLFKPESTKVGQINRF